MKTHALAIAAVLAFPAAARAETYTISPATVDSSEEFENLASSLQPGDELILRGGVYSQTGARSIRCAGTSAQPIVIRAADGETPIITRPADPKHDYTQNGTEFASCSYLVIRGLHFRGGDIGLRFIGGHHITLEDCEISETANNAIAMNSGNTDSFIIRRNHIHHTGLLDSSLGVTEGEGLYVGCNNNACTASNHLIEGNYIHHLRATSDGGNDGIEIKYGSYGNVIRNNVIHDTTIGTDYPGILVYGVADPATQAPNVVEGNVIWNSGEAIQVVSDAIIRNNIVLNSISGIASYGHSQVPGRRNVSIVGNTILNHGDEGAFLSWSGASNMVFANNAVFNPAGTYAIRGSGFSGASIAVLGNVVEGTLSGLSVDGQKVIGGGRAEDAFVAVPGIRSAGGLQIGSIDLWPAAGSVLLGKGSDAHAPAFDFNGASRTSPFDAGAYEAEGLASNPGWKIVAGFKDAPATPPDTLPPAPPTNLRVK
jgi:hypothetical protein